jgi:hypothetical protein
MLILIIRVSGDNSHVGTVLVIATTKKKLYKMIYSKILCQDEILKDAHRKASMEKQKK